MPDAPLTPQQFWDRYFAPLHAAAHQREADLSEDAFLDTTLTVCGVELRGMTPRDLLLLSAAKNPFVTGGRVDPEHVAQFIVLLLAYPPRGWLARRRFRRYLAGLDYAAAIVSINAYVDRMFLHSEIATAPAPVDDAATAAGAPLPPRINLCFLAPLITKLALETGGWGEDQFLGMRLDKLFQYRAAIAARDGTQRYSAADQLISRGLEAYGRYLATGETPELPASPSAS